MRRFAARRVVRASTWAWVRTVFFSIRCRPKRSSRGRRDGSRRSCAFGRGALDAVFATEHASAVLEDVAVAVDNLRSLSRETLG